MKASEPFLAQMDRDRAEAIMRNEIAQLEAREALRAGREKAANERADRWLDRCQSAITYLQPEKMRLAYEWAVAMEATDIPKSMSDWLLDGALIESRTVAERGNVTTDRTEL